MFPGVNWLLYSVKNQSTERAAFATLNSSNCLLPLLVASLFMIIPVKLGFEVVKVSLAIKAPFT